MFIVQRMDFRSTERTRTFTPVVERAKCLSFLSYSCSQERSAHSLFWKESSQSSRPPYGRGAIFASIMEFERELISRSGGSRYRKDCHAACGRLHVAGYFCAARHLYERCIRIAQRLSYCEIECSQSQKTGGVRQEQSCPSRFEFVRSTQVVCLKPQLRSIFPVTGYILRLRWRTISRAWA